jgi:sugar lactone lactonase YvrE
MATSPLASAISRIGARLLPLLLLAIAPAGCGGGGFSVEFYGPVDGDPHHHDKPDKPDAPQRETGVFLIAGNLCGDCVGTVDGAGSAARFNRPGGITADGNGNLFVAETPSSTIRRVTMQGVVTTVAGVAGARGAADGSASVARFNLPGDLAADRNGNLYVSDTGNQTIRKVSAAGLVTTLAGSVGVCGSADGSAMLAQFCDPRGIALDASGNLYVADTGNHTIRMIDPAGRVSTIAGSPGVCGSADGRGSAAHFCQPRDITVDRKGLLYVADTSNSSVRMINLKGEVTTLAGRAPECGAVDGQGAAARLCRPASIAVDDDGDLYVADTGNSTIRRIDLQDRASTVGGVPAQHGIVLGPLPGGLNAPAGITVAGPQGTLAVTTQNLVLKVVAGR